ncbi:MAG TPA: signal peptidase II [Caulobacteraceae bacterium]
MTEQTQIDERPQDLPAVTRWGLVAYAVAAAVVVLDQISKWWILDVIHLPDHSPIRILPVFQLTMVWNTGVSFGLLRADAGAGRWLLVLFALAIVIALGVWARRMSRPLAAAALGLILGGALGNNLIDRVRFGAVADFLDFHALYFPWVFNIADSGITIGVALLLLDSFVHSKA